MPLRQGRGDLLRSSCMVLVNPVNCYGVAGAGLAKQFKDRFPKQVAEYTAFCQSGAMQPGTLHEALLPDGRSILSVPTKRHWSEKSRYGDILLGVEALAEYCRKSEPASMALPALGCGLGGLPQHLVRNTFKLKLSDLPCEIYVYGLELNPDE